MTEQEYHIDNRGEDSLNEQEARRHTALDRLDRIRECQAQPKPTGDDTGAYDPFGYEALEAEDRSALVEPVTEFFRQLIDGFSEIQARFEAKYAEEFAQIDARQKVSA